mmetsp:Transcript_137037/g.324665  ORF Transcript_137037/g.324665 Transcript_137037/m.324665 type:complete len:222 (-) Transcript_137037:743-1408(-)
MELAEGVKLAIDRQVRVQRPQSVILIITVIIGSHCRLQKMWRLHQFVHGGRGHDRSRLIIPNVQEIDTEAKRRGWRDVKRWLFESRSCGLADVYRTLLSSDTWTCAKSRRGGGQGISGCKTHGNLWILHDRLRCGMPDGPWQWSSLSEKHLLIGKVSSHWHLVRTVPVAQQFLQDCSNLSTVFHLCRWRLAGCLLFSANTVGCSCDRVALGLDLGRAAAIG